MDESSGVEGWIPKIYYYGIALLGIGSLLFGIFSWAGYGFVTKGGKDIELLGKIEWYLSIYGFFLVAFLCCLVICASYRRAYYWLRLVIPVLLVSEVIVSGMRSLEGLVTVLVMFLPVLVLYAILFQEPVRFWVRSQECS